MSELLLLAGGAAVFILAPWAIVIGILKVADWRRERV